MRLICILGCLCAIYNRDLTPFQKGYTCKGQTPPQTPAYRPGLFGERKKKRNGTTRQSATMRKTNPISSKAGNKRLAQIDYHRGHLLCPRPLAISRNHTSGEWSCGARASRSPEPLAEGKSVRCSPSSCNRKNKASFNAYASGSWMRATRVEAKRKKRREIEGTSCFGPLCQWVVRRWSGDEKRLALAVDATSLGNRWTSLAVSVALNGGAIPVAWKGLPATQEGA